MWFSSSSSSHRPDSHKQERLVGRRRTGRYPKPVKLGPRTTVWRVEDIKASSKAWVRTAAMNSDIQQSGSFRRYSERLLPCRSSTEYPRLAKRNLFFRNTKTVKQKGISRLSRLSPIQTRSGHDTHKVAPVYAPQSFPDTCAVTVRPTFRYPPRHAPHANHALSRIQIERLLHDAQAFTAYRLPVSRTVARVVVMSVSSAPDTTPLHV